MKRIGCLLVLAALLLSGQNLITPTTLADIAGDGAVHPIAATGSARWITFISLSTNSTANCSASSITGCVRIGDTNISNARGVVLVPGATYAIFESSGILRHSLSGWNYLVQSGDKLSITYGQ